MLSMKWGEDMQTSKDLENDLKKYAGGGSFITLTVLAGYLGQKNLNRVKNAYLKGLPRLEGTRSYYIPDVAKNIWAKMSWD